MLLNRVAVGKVYYTDVSDTERNAPPSGYDSVCGLVGSQLSCDATVVYTDEAIIPVYLITYDSV
ncbi:hypothetical protein FRB94_001799 [Tulasnella sp. JGI-2019a]|nr:hypothetical protein FRB94_001799 [Tulasnella sp. JGI-2019a]